MCAGAARELGLGVRQREAWTARTTESESSKEAMHPVLASSRRILALTYRRMFSGLLIRTTPVAIAVVCGAHERISCLAASLPDAERTRTRVSHCRPVPGAWWRARAHRRRRRSWEVRKHCKYQAAAGRALVEGPWCSLISRWFSVQNSFPREVTVTAPEKGAPRGSLNHTAKKQRCASPR